MGSVCIVENTCQFKYYKNSLGLQKWFCGEFMSPGKSKIYFGVN